MYAISFQILDFKDFPIFGLFRCSQFIAYGLYLPSVRPTRRITKKKKIVRVTLSKVDIK